MERIRQLNNLVGIDVGCTNIKMTAIVDNHLMQESVRSGDDFTRNDLVYTISSFYDSFGHNFDGIGIAFSGCTTDELSVYRTTLPCLEGLSYKDFDHLNCKVRLINDSNATALAGLLEYPDANVLLGVTNGTGIGLGIVINGHLFTGSHGLAGEIYGNPVLNHEGKLIKSGKICSGSKVLKKLNDPERVLSEEDIIEQAASHLGMELVSLVHIFNPDVIYLAGGGFAFPGYFKEMASFVFGYAYPHFLNNLEIKQSSFGSFSGCFGAMKYVHDLSD